MKNIRTVFFGTSDFAAAILKTLYEEGYQIAAAVSQPNRPSGRKNKIVPTPVAAYCAEKGIPLLAQLPIAPELAKECDTGVIELFNEDWLNPVMDAVENCPKRKI